jgi:hypothetical protein
MLLIWAIAKIDSKMERTIHFVRSLLAPKQADTHLCSSADNCEKLYLFIGLSASESGRILGQGLSGLLFGFIVYLIPA